MKKQIPNMCSILNATLGLTAVLVTLIYKSENSILISCILICCGGLLDSIDGKLARKFDASSQMGKELDSFADLITFGVSPSCVLLGLISLYNPRIYLVEILIVVFYVMCAMYRLARYNSSECTDSFVGLPTTFSGSFLALCIFLSNMFLKQYIATHVFIMISMFMLIFLGFAMISKIKVKRIF